MLKMWESTYQMRADADRAAPRRPEQVLRPRLRHDEVVRVPHGQGHAQPEGARVAGVEAGVEALFGVDAILDATETKGLSLF